MEEFLLTSGHCSTVQCSAVQGERWQHENGKPLSWLASFRLAPICCASKLMDSRHHHHHPPSLVHDGVSPVLPFPTFLRPTLFPALLRSGKKGGQHCIHTCSMRSVCVPFGNCTLCALLSVHTCCVLFSLLGRVIARNIVLIVPLRREC